MSKMSGFVEDGSSGVSSAGASSPSSVARLVIVFGELSDDSRTEVFLRTRLVEDLISSWNANLSMCDLNKELKSFVTASPIRNSTPAGEETLLFQSSVLHTEVLVNFGVKAVNDKLMDLHSDGKGSPFTLVIYVGLILPPTGLWLLCDGPYLPNTYGNSHDGPCPTVFEISGSHSRGAESSATEREGIDAFCSLLFQIVRLEPTIKGSELLPSKRAPQFYDRPTMYVFPSGQGSSAFFGMADFSLLADTGYGRNPFCWDLIRLQERLDVLLITHLGIHNLFGVKSMLEKMKMMDELSRPKIGHMFLNCWKQNEDNSVAVAVRKDLISDKGVNVLPDSRNQTMLNWRKEAMSITRDLEQLKIDPQPCMSEGIETHVCLYHKVGIGSACLDVLWPNNNEQLKQFLKTWKDEITDKDFMDRLPAWDMFSVCAVLYWLPSPQGKHIRVLLTGGAPESVVFAGLEKLKRKAKLGKPMDSCTCLCKDACKDPGNDRTGNETTKKPEPPKKGHNGGRIHSKEKQFVAKVSGPKGNGAVGSGSTVTAQQDAKQHAKPPSGVSCGKSRETKSYVGAKGHSSVKVKVGQAKGLDARVEIFALLRAECDDVDEYAESKRVDALGKASDSEGAGHLPKHGDQHTIHRNMKQANKLLKAAIRSSAHTKKSCNVRTVEEMKKDVGKSIDVHAGEETKDVVKSSDVCASEETKEDVGKSSDARASEETKEGVGKSSDARASEETKEDVGKSSDARASEETKEGVGKSSDARASEETKEDVGKSSDARAREETKEDVGKSSDARASEETKEDVGKSSDARASEETKEDVGKSSDARASEETKEDVGKSSDARASEETKEDVGKSSDARASEETKEDVGKSSDARASEETKEDVGKSSDARASEETNEDVGKSSDARAIEETKEDVGKSSDARASEETKEDVGKSSDARASEETKEDVGKSSDARASEETKEDVGKSSDACASEETKEDVGKSSDARASEETKEDVGKSSDARAREETQEDVGKSSDARASEETKEDVGKSSDARASEETKEDVGKSSDARASEETKEDVGKSSDARASEETKEDVGKSSDARAIEETKEDVGKSRDARASEETKEDVGKSSDARASEETKEDVGKSSDARTSEETKEDVGKSSDARASEETKEDVGKSSDARASEETKEDVGKSSDARASEETKEDVGKSSDARASEETKEDVGKSSDVRASEETKAAAKSCCANEEDFSKSSDASESKETNEEIGKSSDVHASDEMKENIGMSGNSLESREATEDLAIESKPGSMDTTSCVALSKDELGKMEKRGHLEEHQESRGSRDEQIAEQAREAAGRELERCPEQAKELTENDFELRGTKAEGQVPFVHKETELPPVEKDAVVSCGAIDAVGSSAEKDMAVPAATKEDRDKPSAKDEVVLPPEVHVVGDVTKEDQDIPAAKDTVVAPSEVSATNDKVDIPLAEGEVVPPPAVPAAKDEVSATKDDIYIPPADDAVVLSFEVAVAKEDRDVPPSEDDMVPPSEVSATKDAVNIPPAEGGVVLPPAVSAAEDGVVAPFKVSDSKDDTYVPSAEDMVVPPSEVPATKEDIDIPPTEGEMPSSSNVLATKLDMDVPPAEDGVMPPSEVPTIKENMDVLPPAGERVLPPSELPAMKGDRDEPYAEERGVPPSKVPATKCGVDVPHAGKGVVPPSGRKVSKVPKKKKRLPSAEERHKALSEVQTLAEKLHKAPVGADDLDRADSLDDLPLISKTDQLSDSKHCSEVTHTFSSMATAHYPDFDVEILRGGSENDFPAMNPFQGIAYKEDIFTAPRSLAEDCHLHFNVELKASSSSDVEQDSLDGDGEHFDPGQAWEPMNLPEPEPPKHLSGAKVGKESNEQRKKRNVRNHKKPCSDDVEIPHKSKLSRETHTNNDKSKRIVADSTLSGKVVVQKSTKVEATRSGLSDLPATVPESKVSEPKTFALRSRPANDEAVYFTVAFIPCRGEPQYVSKLFFQRVRARYYVLSSVSHELSFLDGLLEAKKEWEEDQEAKFPVSIIPTHGSKVLEEWVASHSEQLLRLNIDVRKAADECKVSCGAADEKDAFCAFQLAL